MFLGQFTEKRIHLSNRLPSWIRSMIPKIFYVTEKAWNYYPYTITDYTCKLYIDANYWPQRLIALIAYTSRFVCTEVFYTYSNEVPE